VLAALWLLVFAVTSQAMILAPILPRMSEQLGIPLARLGTLVTGYAVAVAGVALNYVAPATGIGWVTACAIYLLLRGRSYSVVLGLTLLGYATNIFIFAMGRLWSGAPPVVGQADTIADPLPQAMVLTAIVITFGVIAFLLALAFRSWQVTDDDEVEDDVEDRRIAREAHGNEGVQP